MYYIIDFDSTFVKLESLDELAKIALQNNPKRKEIVKEIQNITNLGMDGKMSFEESLERRLKLFSPTKQHIQELIILLEKNITHSVERNKSFFVNYADSIFIISGGFREYIIPIVYNFGIPAQHILANTFLFDEKNQFVGHDKNNPLAKKGGKAKIIDTLCLQGEIVMIGDGYTDYEVKEAGKADTFYAFVENVKREKVMKKADKVIESFDEIII